MERSMENIVGKFKVCPKPACGAVNHPVANFCRLCAEDIRKKEPVGHAELPPANPKTHSFLGGIPAEDFADGTRRLLDERELTSEQEKARDDLEAYVSNLKLALRKK